MSAAEVFDAPDIARLRDMSERDLDAMPFGVIKLDREGKILAFNTAESELSGFVPAEVIGRNFFHDVAPCTRTRKFFGAFQDGVSKGQLKASFEYRFDLQSRPSVWVHMANGAAGEYLIVVKRIGYNT